MLHTEAFLRVMIALAQLASAHVYKCVAIKSIQMNVLVRSTMLAQVATRQLPKCLRRLESEFRLKARLASQLARV